MSFRGAISWVGLRWSGLRWVVASLVVAVVVAVPAGIATTSKARASARPVRLGPRSQLTLSRAPGGLRTAVRRTLGEHVASGGWSQQAKLTERHGAANDQFGWSVSVSKATAVVGVPNKNSSRGAAYVFVRSGTTWSQQATLTAPDARADTYFGYSVAISGSTAVVGATGRSAAGAAYVFVRSGSTWSQQAQLTARHGARDDALGTSVAISGATAVVGAPFRKGETGAAYVFVRSGTTWSQQAALTAADACRGDQFGSSVSISGSTAVVGAPVKDSFRGAAYVFVRSRTRWSQQAKLTESGSGFGTSVAISGSTALVGTNGRSGGGPVYVFVRSGTTWSPQAKLTHARWDFFGTSVAISGSTAVIGANAQGKTATGAAYVFVRSGTTWSQRAKLTASEPAAYSAFGYSVGISGSTALVGAPYQNSSTGAAYVFAGE